MKTAFIVYYIAEWFWPEVTGSRPPPCADISFIKTSDLKVVMLGGYEKNTTLLSGVYQLNLENWVSPNSRLYHVFIFVVTIKQPPTMTNSPVAMKDVY